VTIYELTVIRSAVSLFRVKTL